MNQPRRETGRRTLSRRSLLLLAGGTVLSVSTGFTWNQLSGHGPDVAKAAPQATPTPATLAPASGARRAIASPVQPAAPAPEAGAQSQVVPVLTEEQRSRPFAARSLPPERVVAPTIDLDSRVIPLGTRLDKTGSLMWETAPFAVGHHLGTANPGDVGNVVLSGHISSMHEGAVFHRLPDLKVGDGVIVFTAQQPYLYRVVDRDVVEPSHVEVLDNTPVPTVTLITCVPDGVYTHRLVVRAEAIR